MTLDRLTRALPRGRTLPISVFQQRHKVLLGLLWFMAAANLVFALFQGNSLLHALIEGSIVAVFAICATWAGNRPTLAAALVGGGLMAACAVFVHLADGLIEAHFLFFIMLLVLTIYEEWVPFLVAALFVLVEHGVVGVIDPYAVYNHADAIANPWLWALIHAGFVSAAGAAGITAWSLNERARSELLATTRRAQASEHSLVETNALLREEQANLQSSEARFRTLSMQAPVGIYETDPHGGCVFVNARWRELTGLTAEQALGDGWAEAIHPEDRESVLAEWSAASNEAREFALEYRFLRPDGRIVWVAGSSTPIQNSVGQVTGYLGTCTDITARRAMEAERALQERRFTTAFDHAPIGKALVSTDGKFLRVNRALCELLGYAEDELLRKTFQDITHPDDLEADLDNVARLLADEIFGYQMEKRYFHADGQTIWILLSASVVRNDEAQPLYFIAQIQDITAQKAARDELAAAVEKALEASRMKSEFMANMSHEIRTPLNGVLGIADLLVDGDLTDEQLRLLGTLRDSGHNLLEIINDVLDYSKGAAGKMELDVVDFDLRDTITGVSGVLSSSAQEKNLAFDLEIDPDVPDWVRGDSTKLRRVLVNLLSNAIKFTEVGQVGVRVRLVPTGTVRFEVMDTGIGMDQAARARILEPFIQAEATTTRRFGGTGLGLSICLQLVELMGGQLEFDSELGRGSTFAFEVPLDTVKPQSTSKPVLTSARQPNPSTGDRVLVVDDGPVNQLVATAMLERLGYETEVASNGAEAVDACARATYAAILMDCLMPVMDGYQATERIRTAEGSSTHTPIIALTASAMAGDREKCLSAGMDDYLSKPFDRALLAETLARCLSGATTVSASELGDGAEVAGPESEPATPTQDEDALDLLERQIGAAAFGQVCDAFLGQVPADLALLESAIDAGETGVATSLAHKLKGSAAGVGADDLRQQLRELELALEGNTPVPDIVVRVREELDRLMASFSAHSPRS